MRARYELDGLHDEHRDRAVLVGVDLGSTEWPLDESLAELRRLVDTAGGDVVAVVTQRLARPHTRTFIGSGKAAEIEELVRSHQANVVVFDSDLTPRQQINIEDLVPDTKVVDRTGLILDIFGMHALSREGKLQVELAKLEYVLPRLRGMWGHLEAERLGGGRGTRFGAGESQLEVDRRMTRKRISDLKRELKQVSRARQTQRKARAEHGVFRVSLVGYTNAGKSTLLNALTGAGVLAENMLFATLDSTTRRLTLPEGREITLTDTVGFIHKLPHGLVEAFKSTLDEVREADLLLHVVDGAHAQAEAQMNAVDEVLEEIDAHHTPRVIVINKIDAMDSDSRGTMSRRHPDAVFVSGERCAGLEELKTRIAREAARGARTMTVLIPYTRGDLVRVAHERTHVISEHHAAEGTRLVMRVPAEIENSFEEFSVSAAATGGTEADPRGKTGS